MVKKLLVAIIMVISIFTSNIPVKALENSEPITTLSCQYAVAIDAKSGLVLYNKNMDERMYPASMTKVMTVIVALEMMKDTSTTTVITQSDIDTVWETGASSANFEVGEVVTYEDLLYGAILPSGADATRALANNLCGSQEAFVAKMNELAGELGLKDTHFVNTTGIHDDNHYTTAHDMALIVKHAIENDKFREIYGQRYHTSSNGLHQWVNKSIYNARRAGIDTTNILGCKSGYTNQAKNCLSSLDTVNGNEIITIVAHSTNEVRTSAAVCDTLDIMNYVGQRYSLQNILTKGNEVDTLKVDLAKDNKSVVITNQNDATAFLPNNFNLEELDYRYSFDKLKAPLKKGTKVGNLEIYYGDYLLYEEDYLTTEAIEKDTVKEVTNNVIDFIFPYGIAIVLVVIYILILRFKPKRRRV
ncbi:MAG TPA: D-alanyl-D-alanine carboxypeptidase [Candidatus Erysipelatoclostridium merdavium]|mgnify:FL=1|uniref:serine-type D-Ala-D-Ala carboxypeptidase n=1 Tax=Candidatus Erysipelatoclostridium merdavium TaxID=2838566 RepID=A0A9D2BMN1_9FIRM|nr:D-alanyl-D-alanine carboxypeptidase family protein [Thomasclavelia sp.]HIX81628.1 D-alanyl-D-alanine carboxypeptidase [Candidatus Erysipelatoclostridium merdavium]